MEPGGHEFKEKIVKESSSDILLPKNMPPGIKKEYKNFALKVKEANSGISEEEAAGKIFETEEKFDYSFFWTKYKKEGAAGLVLEKRRLLAMEELHVLGKEEKMQLDTIKNKFNESIYEICKLTGESPESSSYYLDKILYSGLVKDMAEAQDILINGPKIQGFEETLDVKIPNKKVSEFLAIAFGKDVLRKSMIALIDKDDRYLIKCDDAEKTNVLKDKFDLDYFEGTNLRIANNKENYKKAEMYLEGVDDESKLKHLYKVRATAGIESGFAKIDLHSFGVEKSGDFDYLKESKLLTSEDEKMRAYILGTAGHEVAHKIEPKGEEEKEYAKIVEEEKDGEEKFVSDYVRRHKDLYGSDPHRVLMEDFTENIRIYLTNADYLRTKFERRYKFIKEKYPFIKENSVIDIVKSL